MIPNRALGVDDYLAMARRRWRMVSVLGLVALIAGLLVSLGFRPTYTSTSVLRVEKPPAVPSSGLVRPPLLPQYLQINYREFSERRDRVIALQGQVLSRSNLQDIVRRLGLEKKTKNVDALIDDIQAGTSITEVDLSTSLVPTATGTTTATPAVPFVYATPGFSISFTSDNPSEAQQICAEITSSFLTEDLKSRERRTADTTDFVSRQLDEARNNLDEQDKKLALFKAQHIGQLPENLDDNLKVLPGLNAQLEASTRALHQAEQDKEFTESALEKQLAAWKGSQEAKTSDSIEHQLATLTTQLAALQTRYTNDHPEVIKTKSDIARLQAKQKEMNASADQDADADSVFRKAETPQILQLRLQIQQDKELIERSKREQKDLRETIATYKNGLAVSPEVEKEYNLLTRDNQIAHTIYEGLLTSKADSEIRADMDRHQQGEQLRILNPPSFPASLGFQRRLLFALYGLGGGLALGVCIALGLELSNKTMRDEADVLAGAELPMLTAISWVGPVAAEEGWRGRFKALLGHKSTA